ncbi:DNA damage-regulated autophagy modulator protein 2-like isoform X2 [Stegodyphus dumicola]|uniref:DNA damage-regulated autophagy modulator protein 2-like isoform X2 n=1 Tax=Stegodyphus dumicola TaxID=202533 RepID=UPI0015B2AF46|nr:DNA damage-regulated autophagy modulator protein 2-like isoform X2 [Stegodyphus dumicola]
MTAESTGVGLVSCACWDHHATVGWEKSGFLIIATATLLGCGLIFPYLTVVIKNLMPAVLPFISQAAGLPPSLGVFAVFMILASVCGMVTFSLFYEYINHRNVKNSRFIRILNKVGLFVTTICCLGLIVTVCNPVGYTDVPNKFQWVVTVLYEHGTGASMILIGGALFQYVWAALWFCLPYTTKTEKSIKLFFIVIYFIFFIITLYPMISFILEELGPNPFDFESMKAIAYVMPIKYSTAYMICAFCEWALCILSIVHILTHFKDLQRVSFRIVLRHKSCLEEKEDPVPSISLKVLS